MPTVGRCGIYENRPQFCRDYPKVTDFLPEGCTYCFIGERRHGECDPTSCQENCCCAYPREEGEPEGASLDELAGGLPCRHLVWVDVEEEEKQADADYDDVSITGEIYDSVIPAIRGDDVL